MKRTIGKISAPFGQTPGEVEVHTWYEDDNGDRDGFETIRIVLPWDVLDTPESERESWIREYVEGVRVV